MLYLFQDILPSAMFSVHTALCVMNFVYYISGVIRNKYSKRQSLVRYLSQDMLQSAIFSANTVSCILYRGILHFELF